MPFPRIFYILILAIVLFAGYFAFGRVLWSFQKWNRIYWVVSLALSDILIGINLLVSNNFVFNQDSLIHGEVGCHVSYATMTNRIPFVVINKGTVVRK